MRKTLLILLAAATPLAAQQQQSRDANTAVSTAKSVWMMSHNYVLRAAEQVPEETYSFRPATGIRSLGELFGHVADAERLLCSMSTGVAPNMDPAQSIEKSKTKKADLIQALKDAAMFCDAAYAQADAAALAAPVNFFGNNVNRMWTLQFNGAHTMEHYGNIVTYMRMKGMTPPSSQR
jgi:uncharacterized damage-inducible protein DinB